jgi:hypothetical protein
VDVCGRERYRERHASSVRNKVAFRTQFAAIRRVLADLFAPLLAGTLAESKDALSQSMRSAFPRRSSSTRCSSSHTPASCQSRRRRQQVLPLPQPSSLGSISQGMPLLRTKMMPAKAARSSTRGRPPLGFGGSGGSRGSMTSHSSSVTSSLLMLTSVPSTHEQVLQGTLNIIIFAIDTPPWFEWFGEAFFTAAGTAITISIGIAILRYRLYEIDIIINRTLVYGALSATLAAVYFGGVTATQAIFRTLTGHEQQPQLAIVVSTLVIAALFNPLRRRIQGFIDRRFYRSKYDAAKTLEAFSAKLRHETDLDALSHDLVGVVRETMQPAHVSLWLRPETTSKGQQAD